MVIVIVDHWTGKGYQLVWRNAPDSKTQIGVYGACSEPVIKTVAQAIAFARRHTPSDIYRETVYTLRKVM